MDDFKWVTPSIYTKGVLKLRRNHIAAMIGYQMLVHGGIDEDGNYLNDSFYLSFNPIKWSKVIISNEREAPHLAYHAAAMVLPMDLVISTKTNVYNLPMTGIGGLKLSSLRVRNKQFNISIRLNI